MNAAGFRSPAFCWALALAVAAHTGLLAWPHHPRGAGNEARTALTVRQLHMLPTPEPAETVPMHEEQLARLRPMPVPLAVIEPVGLPTPSSVSEPREDAPEPRLYHPDAALPGGQAQVHVRLDVEHDGHVRALSIEPDVLPPAFEVAVTDAFVGSRIPPEAAGGERSGRLCVQVQFREGQPPSWQASACGN